MYKRFSDDGFDALTSLTQAAALRDTALQTIELFGLNLVDAAFTAAADHIVARAAAKHPTVVNFLILNAHCVNVAARNRAYRQRLAESDLLLPDGSGMRIAAHMAGKQFGDNLNGTDLFPALCERAAKQGLAIYLLGGSPGTAERAAAEMQRRYPGLIVAGTQHGYFSEAEQDQVIARINRARPALLFVGFGVPLQEEWIASHRDALDVPVKLGVGGLFDYYAGNVVRAPQLVRKVGCEWAWRLAQEPRRLAKRYLWGNFAFLAYAFAVAVAERGARTNVYTGIKRVLDFSIELAAGLP
ncbi:WecB/TagA/CpsF family glycosyl transferase [Salinisphaera sp. T5B8]|uniref:WecB/TagA/CpsF family glycosyltransferase n=1 Tax=Salinisphaera sp. T5B8 TaxID=1304154 RepID=UPI0033400D4E